MKSLKYYLMALAGIAMLNACSDALIVKGRLSPNKAEEGSA